MYKCWFDGASRGNPGPAACAYIIEDNEWNEIVSYSKYLELKTNNQAEYSAIGNLLHYIADNKDKFNCKEFTIYGDSQLVINQLTGKYKVNSMSIYSYYKACKKLMEYLQNLGFKLDLIWVGRGKNSKVDELVNKCLDRQKLK